MEKELRKHYKSLKPMIEKLRTQKFNHRATYSLCLRATFIKAFDYNYSLNCRRSTLPAFFTIPPLRGICEDIIYFRCLASWKVRERDSILRTLMLTNVFSNLKCQTKFFKTNRLFQDVLPITPNQRRRLKRLGAKAVRLWQRHGFNNVSSYTFSPSTRSLARQANLLPLYDYLYHAASEFVHFNPRELLRSGWGDMKGGQMLEVRFSSENFSLYYREFAVVYGSYLLCLFVKLLARNLRIPKDVLRIVERIDAVLMAIMRWPELVTYEEMNVRPPGVIHRIFKRAMIEREGAKK